MEINEKSTRKQSLAAYNQWCVQWREHAKHHSKYKMKSFNDFANKGIGKAVLCVANGYSLELEIETIKKLQHNVDILCCDKTLGHLIDNGITPTYCMVCDANVNFERYMEPWKDKLDDVILFSNICANTKWTDPKYWKDVYFFVNEDVIDSHKEFSEISGCKNFIPAATNVSNEMVVLLTQSNNKGRANFFGYDKILLIGFDYSWTPNGHYYAFNEDGDGKYNYMRHITLVNIGQQLCFTSTNLMFSMSWLKKYIDTFNLPVVQCHRHSILSTKHSGNLSEQMRYNYNQGDADKVRRFVKNRIELKKQIDEIDLTLNNIGTDHYYSYLRSV